MKNFNQKALSALVSMLMTTSICYVATVQASDIEIYKLPDKSKLTIYMMLDTSGSMDAPYMQNTQNKTGYSACDIPSNSTYFIISDFDNNKQYSRNYCQVGGSLQYYYRSNKEQTSWYSCGSSGRNEANATVNNCNTSISMPNLTGYVRATGRSTANDYYAISSGSSYKRYDRITRLKDALYALAVSDKIPNTTKIGVGTYSYGGSGTKGFIRIFANEWGILGSEQRGKLLSLIRDSSFVGTGGTPTAQAYAEAAAALLGTTSGSNGGVGQSEDNSTVAVGGTKYYSRPVDDTDPKCSGKGVYVLTDGLPSTASNAGSMMTSALKPRSGGASGYDSSASTFADKIDNGWSEIGKFAKSLMNGNSLQALFSSQQRNDQHQVKTAVVGFGSEFNITDPNVRKSLADPKTGKIRTYYNCSLITGNDQKNTCYWGNKTKFSDGTTVPNIGAPSSYGEGGFYSADSTDEVITSFTNFVEDMKPEFEPIATGSPTIPVDALNPIQLQPYGYYATFTPKPQEDYQLWLGNLNKYNIFKGQLYNELKTTPLIKSSGVLDETAIGIWGGDGMLGKLPLGTSTTGNIKSSNRSVFTNRQINNNAAQEATSLQEVNLETLFDADATKAKFKNDPKKNYWLNVLGYKVPENSAALTIATLPAAEQRQLGAVMHSKPVLLTQEGKIYVPVTGADKGKVITTDRQDYLLFGSNQGMLHVVDVKTGIEVFSFVPNEMMEKQPKGFLSEDATSGGKNNLYYGIDGAWTAFTQYVSKTDRTLTVADSERKDGDDKYLNQKGLQWVYGGLRMGGRSYYSLDLGVITKPSLKFHINPDAAAAGSPLSYMGQSWSKPTLTYVNWGGTRKLVMLVGGGYDAGGINGSGLDASGNRVTNGGYEDPAYEQNQAKPIGAGVYMFDASDGELLWWASSNVETSTAATAVSGVIGTKDSNLKYSVVSQINAVDRDGDGLSDTLYFGDLGGQAFRMDINNKAEKIGSFAKRVVRLYTDHKTDGTSPRFYEMPSFSVHKGEDGLFGVVALSSGNRSSPLAGTHMIDGSQVVTKTANDAVYVIYDNDVARSDLYSIANNGLRTSPTNTGVTLTNATFDQLKTGIPQTTGTGNSLVYNGGWKYQYSATAGKYKGMNELYALDGMLYVNVFHKDGTGIKGDCGSGVIGDSELYQFCLPTGKCSFYKGSDTKPNNVIQGGGILGATLGQGFNNNSSNTGIVIKRPVGDESLDCELSVNKNKSECQLFDNGARLKQLRWYESR